MADPWLEANSRRLENLRSATATWAESRAGSYSPAERVRVDLERTKRLPSLAEIDLLAGHSPTRPPGRVNIWASPSWWRSSSRWLAKLPEDVPMLFRSKPGELVAQALTEVDATHLAAALRTLDVLPKWKSESAKRAKHASTTATGIRSMLQAVRWPEETRRDMELMARELETPSTCSTNGGKPMPIGDLLLAAAVGVDLDNSVRQSKEAARRRFFVPTWHVLAARLGWGWVEIEKLVCDPAWIPLCPEFLAGDGYRPDRIRMAVERANK